jgi:hypothetical protein
MTCRALHDALAMMVDDCEHLLDILEGRAEQKWGYEYQRQRIASARAALAEQTPCPA